MAPEWRPKTILHVAAAAAAPSDRLERRGEWAQQRGLVWQLMARQAAALAAAAGFASEGRATALGVPVPKHKSVLAPSHRNRCCLLVVGRPAVDCFYTENNPFLD